MKRLLVVSVMIFALSNTIAQQKVQIGDLDGDSGFLKTNFGEIYYETYGEGEPLLILHGNGGSIRGRDHITSKLMGEYKVILMDSRCHGRSSCSNSDLNYVDMATDAGALMDHLGFEKYTIWGHSDGGIIGLILGYTRTEKIEKMLISGANTRPDSTALQNSLVEFMSRYEQIEDSIMRKHIKLMVYNPHISIDNLRKVDVPVMLMVGDRDAIKLEHTIEIFKALPNANLCILPGTTHFISSERPEQVIYWLKELKKPFSTPSTIAIAEQMAKSIFKK